VYHHGQEGRGVEPMRTKEDGSIFRDFVWTFFMDGTLPTAKYLV